MGKDRLRSRLEEYWESLRSMETERWVGEFAENATVEDPVGGPVISGHDQLRGLFKQLCKTFSLLDMKGDFVIVSPPEAVARWLAQGVTHQGVKVNFEGVSTFKFKEDGKIIQMRAFWDQREVARQLKP